MTTTHNISSVEVEHESAPRMEPIERHVTHVTLGNVTYITGSESVTLRSERGLGLLALPQKMIEPAPWGVHPFYSDMDRTPAFLELGPQQLGNLPVQVERSAIAEMQARPHRGSLA